MTCFPGETSMVEGVLPTKLSSSKISAPDGTELTVTLGFTGADLDGLGRVAWTDGGITDGALGGAASEEV